MFKPDNEVLPTGTCFEDCTWFFVDTARRDKRLINDPTWVLVHGICHLEDGRPYSHAWVEHGDKVWFSGLINGALVFLKASVHEFYREYEITDTTKYTFWQAVDADQRHKGQPPPWELKYRRLCNDYKG
jgi:hypothetical protein